MKSNSQPAPVYSPRILSLAMREKRPDIRNMLAALGGAGRFIISKSGECLYFDGESKQVTHIVDGNRDFMVVMGRHGFCPDKAFLERAQRHAMAHGVQADIHRMAHYDGTTLHVYNQGSIVYHVTATAITASDNGDDGIYFLREPDSAPFSMLDLPSSGGDLLLKHLLQPFSFTSTALSVDQARFLVLAWIFALFLPELVPLMPILVVVGPPSSGKTTLMSLISELLFGHQHSIIRAPGDPKIFDQVISKRGFVCMDNVLDWSPWLDGRLESISRRETIRMRLDRTWVDAQLHCAMAMTARQLPDSGLQCLTRMLPVVLERPGKSLPERILLEGVRENRDAIMTFIIEKLQKVLAGICSPGPCGGGSYSMGDFADVTMRITTAIGGFEAQAADAFEHLSRLHDNALPPEQQVVRLLDIWLKDSANVGRQVRATELQREVSEIAKQHGISFTMSERSFAHWIKARLADIRQFFEVEAWEARSRQFFYRFRTHNDSKNEAEIT